MTTSANFSGISGISGIIRAVYRQIEDVYRQIARWVSTGKSDGNRLTESENWYRGHFSSLFAAFAVFTFRSKRLAPPRFFDLY